MSEGKEWNCNPPCGVYRTLYATERFGFPFLLYRDANKALGHIPVVFNSDIARADWRNQSVEIDLFWQLFCARGRLHRQGWNEERGQKLVRLCQKQRNGTVILPVVYTARCMPQRGLGFHSFSTETLTKRWGIFRWFSTLT